MAKKDYSNIGNDIKDIVQNALNSEEFKELNKNITATVARAMDEVKRSGEYWQEQQRQQRENNQKAKRQAANGRRNREKINKPQPSEMVARNMVQNTYSPVKKQPNNLISKSPHGRISGMLLMIFGNIGIGVTLLLLLIFSSVFGFAFTSMPLMGISAGILLPIFTVSALMSAKGSNLRGRVKRFRQYSSRLRGREFCKVSDLSDPIGRSKKYVVKDLRKMISLGMFPQGRFDEDEEYLLISDEAYQNHLKLKEGKKLQEEKARMEQVALDQKRKIENENPEMKAVHEVIAEGQDTIRQINEANIAIEGEIISQKLDRLEKVITKIFEFIEENPDGLPEIRKFMGYYLPTTLKLVSVYRDLDAEPIQGANILATKKEIEDTLDTISHAFENLLDSFYEDTAMDVSTDISVLNTMLAQEGLTNREFKK
ncbi:5-bromo-4-chloroindolyl phosphate hydrolysis family protein [Acetobacterium wieringae]|uniref:5-bromo-4-chloroindolyl phosphate hydrolysis family protein n=1 Tax=Acetobacterium wieringae TaxID=52694 RepID=UPI0026ECE331|nr:5-bromo-4-chloroindolyl phosphate hydrolysis family protein [Acetobacterium wieringae]